MTDICVIGLGYVGLPLIWNFATAFSHDPSTRIFGIDNDKQKVHNISKGIDPSNVLPPYAIMNLPNMCQAISDTSYPVRADLVIICVPTPVTTAQHLPDYTALDAACYTAGHVLKEGGVVCIESTVEPGTTEGRCANIVEKTMGTKRFFMAYSPERINPDPNAYARMASEYPKIIASPYQHARDAVRRVYSEVFTSIVELGDIRAAELAKCHENAQRDLNIAMMNELSIACIANGVSFTDTVKALRTRSDRTVFDSGIVGGHCIAVDPYYLAHWYGPATHSLPQHSRELCADYVTVVASMAASVMADGERARILLLGASYKRDVSDTRNSAATQLSGAILAQGKADYVEAVDPIVGMELSHPPIKGFNMCVGLVNHGIWQNTKLIDLYPFSAGCNFLAVDNTFSVEQTAGFNQVIYV